MLYAILLRCKQLNVVRVITMTNIANLGTTGTDNGTAIFKQKAIRSMQLRENFRRNLPVLMERFGYSQASLAEALGVHRSVVNSWLSGRQFISEPLADKLAGIFGLIDPSLLFSNSLEPLQVFQCEEEAIEFLAKKMRERKKTD